MLRDHVLSLWNESLACLCELFVWLLVGEHAVRAAKQLHSSGVGGWHWLSNGPDTEGRPLTVL